MFPWDKWIFIQDPMESSEKVMFSQASVCSQGGPHVTITYDPLDVTGTYAPPPLLVTSGGHHKKHRYQPPASDIWWP